MKQKTAETLVAEAFAIFRAAPPDLREINDASGEVSYVEKTLPSYVRTVEDIEGLFPNRDGLAGLNIVELGAFLGIVSKALSLDGANVIACDIPEFFSRPNVRSYYDRMAVRIEPFNLRDYRLPFLSSSQDCVIACETFEHLNFNPLPVIAEINRVLKTDGILYISMPNGAYFPRRLKYLLTGNMPGFTVKELFSQLDSENNMVVGLHWKEYSTSQTIEMVSPIGFNLLSIRETNDTGTGKRRFGRRLLDALIPGGDTQVAIFRKNNDFENTFTVCADS